MPNIVKNTTFPNLLDVLAPHSCRGCGRIGEVLCNRCKNNIILNHTDCPPHFKPPKSFPPTFIVSDRTDLINILIHDFKYNSVRALASPLTELVHSALPNIEGPVTVVPLPTVSHHIRARGLDHTYLIAKKLARIRSYSVEKLLVRQQNTVQVGASRKNRLIQARNAYAIKPNTKIDSNTTYILFDDVWTTGASMKAAVQLLKKSGAKKIIVAILAISRFNQ